MAKAPAIQFYVKDWLSDPELRMASHSTKGIWIDMLCYMWESSERGKICGTLEQIKKLVSATDEDMDLFLSEAKSLQFCDVTICNKNVTVINRRIHQDYKDKQNTRLRVQKFRQKQKGNADVTPSTPSSTPSPTPKKQKSINTLSSGEPNGACPQKEIIELYHTILPELPQVRTWPESNQKILRTRWKEEPERQTITWWESYFKYIHESAFLTGRETDFTADLEWVVRPKNMTKILNGRYHKQKHGGIMAWLTEMQSNSPE